MSARAAIDIGTNSVRLLVRDGDRDLDRRSVITRFGEGVERTGRLAPEAIERTVSALKDFGQALRDYVDVYELGEHDKIILTRHL